MTRTRFLPAAKAEFLKEIGYDSNVREGLGIRFQLSVMAAVGKAAENPVGGAASRTGTRSRWVKGFPFSVISRASSAELLIIAVVHHRRRPEYLLPRVK